MIFGKVYNNDKIYISPIFAISCGLRNCKVIIFDENYSELIIADLYKDYKNTIFYLKYDYNNIYLYPYLYHISKHHVVLNNLLFH